MHRLLYYAAAAILPVAQAQVTYSKEVSRIFQQKCQLCHRNGDIAPFALDSYEAAVTWGEDIRRVVEARLMPPWKPVDGHGDFRDNFGLTEEERRTIVSWVNLGMPQGDPADLPPPLPESGPWPLGEPDLVLTAPRFDVPRAKDLYRCFVLPTGLEQNRYVTAVETLPGNRSLVHHVLYFIDSTGESEKKDGADGRPGYDCFGGPGLSAASLGIGGGLGGWVPGMRVRHTPEGVGLLLPARSRIVAQVHYYPNGRAASDQTSVGLYFARDAVRQRLLYVPLWNDRFTIPAGAERFEVNAVFPPLLFGAKALVVAPHMHLLGREIRLEAAVPRQGTRSLIYINDWDFNWQGFYTYKAPVDLPAFTTLRLRCTFDNSAGNPRNPNNPVKPVSWGEGTEDEMCLAFLGVTLDNENLLPVSPAP